MAKKKALKKTSSVKKTAKTSSKKKVVAKTKKTGAKKAVKKSAKRKATVKNKTESSMMEKAAAIVSAGMLEDESEFDSFDELEDEDLDYHESDDDIFDNSVYQVEMDLEDE